MTDIVIRLRDDYEKTVKLCEEAAEEIDRLRFLLKEGLDNGYFDYEMQTAQDWIERVTTAIRGQTEQLQMEIEQLRAENKVWTDRFAKHDDRVSKVRKAVEAERESCAKVTHHFTGSLWTPMENEIAKLIEEAIRNQP